MGNRTLFILLPLLLCQCGLLKHPRQTGTGQGAQTTRRGWALMMSDAELAAAIKPTAGGTGPSSAATAGGDSPEAVGLFDFSGMLQQGGVQAPSRVAWLASITEATRTARTSGRPVLIYMTHPSSKPAQEIEATLMQTPEFCELVNASFVPVRMDFSDQTTNRSPLYRDLKQRFSIRGYPTLVVTLPDGGEVKRLTGYRPDQSAGHLATLRNAVAAAERMSGERRTKLEGEGYRLWKNKSGQPVFAKLTALDANMGSFTGEWGDTFKTFLTRLSEEDQQWIAERRR